MQETTKRWVSDNNTDSYLTQNIRPLTLAFLTATLFIYIILDSSLEGFKIDPNWIDLLSSLLLLVYGGYFGMRSAEKITKHWKNK
jgi:membrane-bound acyltransferase YfiQ involved in biofilm formation